MPDREYVLARRVLLDMLGALGVHRDAVVLVGAQAIYLHAGEADFAVAPFTTDADLVLDPSRLLPEPLLREALLAAGFTPGVDPGIWLAGGGQQVDLLVPTAVGGAGRRGARLGVHGNSIARKTTGLEAVLVDQGRRLVSSLEPDVDPREFVVQVAGPAALLVAKAHKLQERLDLPDRTSDKDALDVLRLLQACATTALTAQFLRLLAEPVAGPVTRTGLGYLGSLFEDASAPGATMAARALEPFENPETVRSSCSVLTRRLIQAIVASGEAH